MSVTHGSSAKRKHFDWQYDQDAGQLVIINEGGRIMMYNLQELLCVLKTLRERIASGWFRLSGDNSNLGTVIRECIPGGVSPHLGSSYLGVVLEECGFLEWNGQCRGIAWRSTGQKITVDNLRVHLSK